MNTNPFWKYLLVIAIVIPAAFYAAPNLFGNDAGIQVVGTRDTEVTQSTLQAAENILKQKGITVKGLELQDQRLRIRLESKDDQKEALKSINDRLGDGYAAALSTLTRTPRWLQDMGAIPMYLGLDLRGGVHFLIQVDSSDAIQKHKSSAISDIRRLAREQDLNSTGANSTSKLGFEVSFKTDDQRDRAQNYVAAEYPDLELVPALSDGKPVLQVTLSDSIVRDIKQSAIEKNMIALRNRIDELGVAEPVVQRQGLDRIVVQLPGVEDPAVARTILGNTATLEIYLVEDRRTATNGRAPAGTKLYNMRDGRPILLKKRMVYSGECIVNATSGFGQQTGGPIVNITLNDRCGSINRDVTGKNLGERMAVVYVETKTKISTDAEGNQSSQKTKIEEVITAPVIQAQLGKRFMIEGLDSPREAQDLALLLRAGSLETPIYIVEERTVGPTLGEQNIKQGFESVLYGFLAVLVFMVFYYRFFGSVASTALVLNLVIIVAVLSLLQATLTLPGVAGIVLTVGMAVDANVLIFERIREEIRNGTTPQAAIHAGYDKAFSTIIDANITTLVAALVLFNFGTGPIKGFAITLSIGILTSMFTAIFVSRVLVNWLYGGRKLDKLPI